MSIDQVIITASMLFIGFAIGNWWAKMFEYKYFYACYKAGTPVKVEKQFYYLVREKDYCELILSARELQEAAAEVKEYVISKSSALAASEQTEERKGPDRG